MKTRMSAKEFRRRAKINGNNITLAPADVEPAAGNEPVGEKKGAGHAAPCSIHVHSIRKRLADADGVSAKACIDGLVHSGILKDDSPKEVKTVSYSQAKAGKGEEEETRILITW